MHHAATNPIWIKYILQQGFIHWLPAPPVGQLATANAMAAMQADTGMRLADVAFTQLSQQMKRQGRSVQAQRQRCAHLGNCGEVAQGQGQLRCLFASFPQPASVIVCCIDKPLIHEQIQRRQEPGWLTCLLRPCEHILCQIPAYVLQTVVDHDDVFIAQLHDISLL
ncbi:MAG: hypothetical protein HY019_11470 [Aquabacterium sp.]|uniref:hypothetical protein n=1 Tax=Aquabacterium sp. TaxID=1872578 RepID=UPI0025BC1645|nr:hypothetical protein [Aquabacterium sp.]MBI3382616.1 hypothetical protein [Aquabacterium sp.]